MLNRITVFHHINLFLLFLIFGNPILAQNSSSIHNFEAKLDELDTAIFEFLNGDAEAFKSIWSHTENITIAGGFGGAIEKGWESINKRLDRVGAVYAKAEFNSERINYGLGDKFGFLVQHEQIKFYSTSNTLESERNYRVTMIFRLGDDGWKLIHRHADASMNWQAPE